MLAMDKQSRRSARTKGGNNSARKLAPMRMLKPRKALREAARPKHVVVGGLGDVQLPADIHVTNIAPLSLLGIARHLSEIQHADLTVLYSEDGRLFDLPPNAADCNELLSILGLREDQRVELIFQVRELRERIRAKRRFSSDYVAQQAADAKYHDLDAPLIEVEASSDYKIGMKTFMMAAQNLLCACFRGGNGPFPQEVIVITSGSAEKWFRGGLVASLLRPSKSAAISPRPSRAGAQESCALKRHAEIVDALRLTASAPSALITWQPAAPLHLCDSMPEQPHLSPLRNRTGQIVGLSGRAKCLSFMVAQAGESALPSAPRLHMLAEVLFSRLQAELPIDHAARAKRFRLMLPGETTISGNKKIGWKIWVDGIERRITQGQMQKLLAFVAAKNVRSSDHRGITYLGEFAGGKNIHPFIPGWDHHTRAVQDVRDAIPKDWILPKMNPDRYELTLEPNQIDFQLMLDAAKASRLSAFSTELRKLLDMLQSAIG